MRGLTCAHFSVSSVERLGQFGKVIVDGVILQPSAISSKTLVQRNSIPLAMGGGGEDGGRKKRRKEERERGIEEEKRRK